MEQVRLISAASGLFVALAATFGATSARAHHSFGFYDMQKTTQIDGTVEKYGMEQSSFVALSGRPVARRHDCLRLRDGKRWGDATKRLGEKLDQAR